MTRPGNDADTVATGNTGTTGIFTVSVPFGTYRLSATAPRRSNDPFIRDDQLDRRPYDFVYPGGNRTVSVAPGHTMDYGTIRTTTYAPLNIGYGRYGDETSYSDSAYVTFNTGHIVGSAGDVTTFTVTWRPDADTDWAQVGNQYNIGAPSDVR